MCITISHAADGYMTRSSSLFCSLVFLKFLNARQEQGPTNSGADPVFAPCRVLFHHAGTLEGSLGELLLLSVRLVLSSVFSLTIVTEGASRRQGKPLEESGSLCPLML